MATNYNFDYAKHRTLRQSVLRYDIVARSRRYVSKTHYWKVCCFFHGDCRVLGTTERDMKHVTHSEKQNFMR